MTMVQTHSRWLPCMQLYVIRVSLGNTAVSTVYAVLQRTSLSSYVELFQAVIDHCHSMELYIDPTTVICDFEQSVIKALQIVLGPAIAIQGCFYHLTQATWRKIQELGLAGRYSTDEEFKLFCGQIDALAFLPFEDIPAGMTSLRDNTPDGADELLSYFDRTYVTGSYCCVQPGHGQIGIRVKTIPPLYPPAV